MEKIKSGSISHKGQMVLPSKIRKKLGLEEGDRVSFIIEDDGKIVVEPLKQYDIMDVVGIVRTDKPFVDVREVIDQVRSGIVSDDEKRQRLEE